MQALQLIISFLDSVSMNYQWRIISRMVWSPSSCRLLGDDDDFDPSGGPLIKSHDTTKFQFSLHRRASVPGSHSSSTNPSPSSVDAAEGDDGPTCRGPSGKVQWCWHLDGACHRTSVADSMHACVHVCTLLFMDIESALLYICH